MQQWKYLVEELDLYERHSHYLNQRGIDGWELVTAVFVVREGKSSIQYVYKKPLSETK
jgi:hypothetical protein